MRLKYEPERDFPEEDSEVIAERIFSAIKYYSPKAEVILDLGMGKGHLVRKLGDEGLNAWGIDLRELGQNRLIVADARYLPFKTEVFDVVVDCYLIADIFDFQGGTKEDFKKIVGESKRVLRKGGLFATVPSERPIEFFDIELGDNGWGFYKK